MRAITVFCCASSSAHLAESARKIERKHHGSQQISPSRARRSGGDYAARRLQQQGRPRIFPGKPVNITIWTYYNGEQLEAFNALVDEFNSTVGKEQGITVESSSHGSVTDLENNVLASAEGKVGAEAMPNIFSAYADTAYALDEMGQIADLSDYVAKIWCRLY